MEFLIALNSKQFSLITNLHKTARDKPMIIFAQFFIQTVLEITKF